MIPAPQVLVDWLLRGGVTGVLVVIIVGFILGWIAPKQTVDRQDSEISRLQDELKRVYVELSIYQRLALGGTDYAEEALKLTKRVAEPVLRTRRKPRPRRSKSDTGASE